MTIVAYCESCGARCEDKWGAWICPTHRDGKKVRLVQTTRSERDNPDHIDLYDLPTGTYNPPGNSKLIFLAGAVTYYWNENWDTPERRAYHAWRQKVRYALIDAGYVTYAGHEGFKGSWNPKCQTVNDHAIEISDVFLILSEDHIPSPGTDDEIEYANKFSVPVVRCPETEGVDFLLRTVASVHVP